MLARMDIQTFASMGGKARAVKLSKDKLSDIGRKASSARWLKRSTLTQDASKLIEPIQVKVALTEAQEEELQCALCRCRGTHKGYYNGVLRLFCSHHFKV